MFSNYFLITEKVLAHLKKCKHLSFLMGSELDALKLLSSLTLFQKAADNLLVLDQSNSKLILLSQYCDEIFALGHPRCQKTLSRITLKQTLYNASEIKNKLTEYIDMRKNEWDFHYNFFGFVSFYYWLQDLLTGTNHFDTQNKTIKISAPKKFMQLIDHPNEALTFTTSEQKALNDGRLGTIFHQYLSLEKTSNYTLKF